MKVIASYRVRSQADEDRIFLMQRGIATIVLGNVGPRVLSEYFRPEPITLAVQDLHALTAGEILKAKYYPHPVPGYK